MASRKSSSSKSSNRAQLQKALATIRKATSSATGRLTDQDKRTAAARRGKAPTKKAATRRKRK